MLKQLVILSLFYAVAQSVGTPRHASAVTVPGSDPTTDPLSTLSWSRPATTVSEGVSETQSPTVLTDEATTSEAADPQATTARAFDPNVGLFKPPVQNVSVLVGHPLILQVYSPSVYDIPMTSWGRSRQWDPTRNDRLSHGGNCTIHPILKDRLVKCDDVLILLGVSYQDAGLYYIKQHGNFEEKLYFQVYVFESQPVLAPIGLHRDRLDVQCYDLKNPQAQLNLEIMESVVYPGHSAKKVKTPVKDSWSLYIQNLERWGSSIWDNYYHIWARCTSTYLDTRTQTSWRSLEHKTHLGSRWARGRPWCVHRGANQLQKVSFDWSHQGALPKGKCYRRYFSASDPIITPCEQVETHIYTVAEARNFKIQRPLGGLRVVAHGPIFTFTPRRNDSGDYVVTDGKKELRSFNLRVQPTLYASIDLIKQQNDGLFLNCTHTGGPEAVVTWEVEGVYGQFYFPKSDRDYQVILYHDCWKNWFDWYYKVGVRCRVRDLYSAAESRWFLAKGTRDPYN